jgi:hypothetical protein
MQSTVQIREEFNQAIEQVMEEFPLARLVRFPSLTHADYVDPVHFNESGIKRLLRHSLMPSYNDEDRNYPRHAT